LHAADVGVPRRAYAGAATGIAERMKFVVFGLSVSSSWGNGHATLWRGLIRALVARGHRVVFFERDVPYYAAHRDLTALPAGAELVLYADWERARRLARAALADAEVGMVTSYCADGVSATELVADAGVPLRAFYDLDTPVTLARLEVGEPVPYIGPRGLRDFDLVLSYTGGAALDGLCRRLGARCVAPLYGSVDPAVHRPGPPDERFRADLSYLGTYAGDRQAGVESLFIQPARRLPGRRFLLGGAQYPADFPWTDNIFFMPHVAPGDHPTFYCSSALTLNVTRRAMAESGWCPSGRLFEAAACGAPILSDWWDGLDEFFTPGEEILVARSTDDAVAALETSPAALAAVARRAYERTLDEHTADHRAAALERALDAALTASYAGAPRPPGASALGG
jgi:spore maturation protein CgeB